MIIDKAYLLMKAEKELGKLEDAIDGLGGMNEHEAFYNGRVSMLMEILTDLKEEE